jgi:hypothetical protein
MIIAYHHPPAFAPVVACGVVRHLAGAAFLWHASGTMSKEKEMQPTGKASASRRRFTKGAAAALVAVPLAVASRRGDAQQPTPSPAEPKAPPNPQPTPTPAPRPSPVAEAYAEVAKARFGKHLTDDEMRRVRQGLEGNVRSAERLRAVKMKNSDEPDFVFTP